MQHGKRFSNGFCLSKNWKTEIRQWWNIIPIERADEFPSDCLWVTRCSKTKTGRKKGLPKEFYTSYLNVRFYEVVEKLGFRYGILSDHYGLHLDCERLEFYDKHPKELSIEDKMNLGEKIHRKCQKHGFSRIVFYNNSPLMSKPYFEILFYSKIESYFFTNLQLPGLIERT